MPPVIGAVAAAGAYNGVTTVLGTGLFASLIAGGAAAVVGGVVTRQATALMPKRTLGGGGGFSTESQERQVLVRSAVEPRRVIYGEVGGLSGPLIFAHVSREKSFGTVQHEESHVIPPASPFQVTISQAAAFYSAVQVVLIQIVIEDGSSTEQRTTLTQVSSSPGVNEYSVANGVYTFNSVRAGQNVQIVYNFSQSSVLNSFFHLVIPLAGHRVQEIGDISLGTDVITSDMLDAGGNVVSGKFAHYVRIKKYLGSDDQQADTDLIAESEGKWTAAHRGRGVAYIYVRLRRNQDLFPNGVPPIRAKVKGALLEDTRTSTTAWSNNWALAVNDYLRKSYGLGCEATEINTTAMNAAANVADEDVEIDGSGTEQKRYTIDGTFSLDERPLDVLKNLLSAGAGAAVYSVSTWDVYAGAYTAPTASLTVSDLAGPLSGRADLERRDLFNSMRGTCPDPDRDWQSTDFPPVVNANYVADDNWEEIPRDIDLPFTPNKIRAQRLAKIYLERARQALTCTWPGKPKLFKLNTFETVNVTVAQLGWNPKVFRVLGWQWTPGGGVDLQMQEEAAAIYDWNFGEATTHDIAPNTTLPNVGPVMPPGAPVVTEELVETRDGRGVAVEVTIACEPSPDLYVEYYQFEVKETSVPQWTVLQQLRVPTHKVRDVAPGVYDWRVMAINGLGRKSVYSQSRREIVGLGARPAAPVIRSLSAAGGLAILTLDPHADLDVRRGGRWRVRHCEDGVTSAWEESFSIGDAEGYVADQTILVLPLKPGTYLVKAEDSTGQQSEDFAFRETEQASVLAFSTVDTLQEDTAFPGTKSGVVAIDGVLKLEGAGLFDDIPDFDAISSLDDYGGVEAEGTYTFSAGFDFGSVSRVRLTGQIEGVTVNVNDLIDDRIGDIDEWLDFDGTLGGGSCDAWLECRVTRDDPNGAPGWSEWGRLDNAEFHAWGVQFRLRIISSDPAYNLHVELLRVVAAEVS